MWALNRSGLDSSPAVKIQEITTPPRGSGPRPGSWPSTSLLCPFCSLQQGGDPPSALMPHRQRMAAFSPAHVAMPKSRRKEMGTGGKEPAYQCKTEGMRVQSLGGEDPLEEGMAAHCQYSCQEIPKDRGAWWAMVRRVAKSRTRLKRLSMHARCLMQSGFLFLSSFLAVLGLCCSMQEHACL